MGAKTLVVETKYSDPMAILELMLEIEMSALVNKGVQSKPGDSPMFATWILDVNVQGR